ncbi:ATP-binding cassette domain-containing protein [Herbaspirillum sp. DW155]|uniref:ABC transporter ATP-binding protein n=1 Tax=Herbaspirillum sp. DW155 TaxID=3095609 RepID=UPI00308C6709|nr:ATP-binding cassette domain-containing protein [Herbaspirillum sp. DW155]
MTTLLEVQDLSAAYGRAQALFGIDFDVHAGEVVTLLGRNGMGRSTTVKCLFGLLRPQRGCIRLAGRAIHAAPSHEISRLGLGLVPEGRQIFSNLSVEENLVATARAPRHKSDPAPWTLQRVYGLFPRLQERRRNQGWQLSGGEQQMLAIGRALMTNPTLLVLDEATEGLSPLIRQEIWDSLSRLKQDGLSQIVIDKNVKPLLKLADRHFVLEKGRVVWSGKSSQLAEQSQLVHQYLGV